MKSILVLGLILVSANVFSQPVTKARAAVLPKSVQAHDAKKEAMKKTEAPCDSKEDILKKLEAEKKAKAEAGKGFSLQGKTDAGCSIK